MAKKKVLTKTRRGNKEGSIFQRKDGRWVGAATVGYDENGKVKRKFIYGKRRNGFSKKFKEKIKFFSLQ